MLILWYDIYGRCDSRHMFTKNVKKMWLTLKTWGKMKSGGIGKFNIIKSHGGEFKCL